MLSGRETVEQILAEARSNLDDVSKELAELMAGMAPRPNLVLIQGGRGDA